MTTTNPRAIPSFPGWKEAIQFAIDGEEQAIVLYQKLGARAPVPELRGIFINFAREEERHKVRLLDALIGDLPPTPRNIAVESLGLSSHLPPPEGDPTNVREALSLAMSLEKQAFKLYTTLAERSAVTELCSLFSALAEEEARHKLFFETRLEDLLFEDLPLSSS